MKHVSIGIAVAIAVCAGTFLLPANADAIFLPFAGRVITPTSPPVVCSGGYGPIMVRPYGFSPPGPYGTTPATIRYLNYVPKPGDVIIGAYVPGLVPGPCFIPPTPTSPPIPFPTILILWFGTSLLPGL